MAAESVFRLIRVDGGSNADPGTEAWPRRERSAVLIEDGSLVHILKQ